MNDVKDFILNFPLYIKTGVQVIWINIKNIMVRFTLKIKKIELKGIEMQEKGKIMWEEAKQERADSHRKK